MNITEKERDIANYLAFNDFKLNCRNGFTLFYGKKYRDLDIEIVFKLDAEVMVLLYDKKNNVKSCYDFRIMDFNTDCFIEYLEFVYQQYLEFMQKKAAGD